MPELFGSVLDKAYDANTSRDPVLEQRMLLQAVAQQEALKQQQQQQQAASLLKTMGVDVSKLPIKSYNPVTGDIQMGNTYGVQSFDDILNNLVSAQESMKQRGLTGYDLKPNAKGVPIPVPQREDVGVYIIDPITGKVGLQEKVPFGSKTYKGVLTPDQMRERALATGEAKSVEENIKTTNKLGGAVKRLALLNEQFKEALPSGDRTPLEQRIVGGASNFAAKYGLLNNPKLVALKNNLRPIAINMIRAFGEVGNLSESEQQGALDVVNQSGLTDEERVAVTRQFIQYALAGASPEGIDFINKRKDIKGILDAFGVDLNKGVDVNIESVRPGAEEDGYVFKGGDPADPANWEKK